MPSKFELPESIFNVTKTASNQPEKPSLIPQNPSVKSNVLLQEQLDFLVKSSLESESKSLKALKIAKWANIIALIAIILSVKDEVLEQVTLWVS